MTKKPQPHQIDSLLRKWSDDHTPDHKHMAALQCEATKAVNCLPATMSWRIHEARRRLKGEFKEIIR
jgi:hypothetical protein